MRRLWPFGLWLTCFYAVWLALVFGGGYWQVVMLHWPIALSMAFGSYIAGSTPMGGGTVGFPVLVLLFDLPGSLGRNFGLAVQSIGMVSASIFLLSNRRPLDWGLLRPAMLGSLVATPLSAAWIAPYIPDLWVKLCFAVVWASFGIMHLVKMRELVSAHRANDRWAAWNRWIGLAIGVSGGVVASITGVGIDMILYAAMVLLFRADLKVSIPTSVVLMAFTSVVGITTNAILGVYNPSLYGIDPEVFANWLAAAPIVALGAPLGALVVNLIPRAPTLYVVSLLCILQFVWTLVHEQVAGAALILALLAVLAINVLFHFLYQLGAVRSVSEPSAQETLAASTTTLDD
ncbi:MAG: sulfite exporter TauE/SafE family protein [Pirellulales bacterium]